MSNLAENLKKIDSIISFHAETGTSMDYDRWPWNFLNSIRAQCTVGGKDLSARQVEVLDDINSKWGREESMKKNALEAAWQAKFEADPKMRQHVQWVMDSINAKSVAVHWNREHVPRKNALQHGYWSSARTLWDSTGRISETDYNRIIKDNPYSQRLIQAMESTPKFDIGQLVCLRAGVFGRMSNWLNAEFQYQVLAERWDSFTEGQDEFKGTETSRPAGFESPRVPMPGMIIDLDPVPSITNARGCRTYKIMTAGKLAEVAPFLVLEERWLKKAPKKM